MPTIPIMVAFTICTAVVVPGVLWAYGVKAMLTSIKDNHLKHIESSTAASHEVLIEIATILRERN